MNDKDRKYRQNGYQDSPRGERPSRERGPRPRNETYGPKPLQMPGTRTVSRCAPCGAVLPSAIQGTGQCPKCGAAIHTCMQCAHFNPGSRFQCSEPVTEAIPDKNGRNECTLFGLRATFERDVSPATPSSTPSATARDGFDALFKK